MTVDDRTKRTGTILAVLFLFAGAIVFVYGVSRMNVTAAWLIGGALLAFFGAVGLDHYGK